MSIQARRKLWRKIMSDDDVATYRVHNGEHWPAVVQNKAMLAPSSCADHPKYQAKREPKSKCVECRAIYMERQNAQGTH